MKNKKLFVFGIFHFCTKVVNCLAYKTMPIETFEDFNSFQNVSDGVANPVTRQVFFHYERLP
jgi:hypothetical protein